MKSIIHRSDSRGVANFGWLYSRHTFSFGNYYNPERVNFGALRVLNDDIVEPGMGFGTHPHDNMEIISIPLQGALAHKDSTGTIEIINTGEVQIMSAGTGLTHSEYNSSDSEKVNFLQIWIIPKERNIEPRYDQKIFEKQERLNNIQVLVAPDINTALWINQDAWLSISELSENKIIEYKLRDKKNNGVYIFVIQGEVGIEEYTLAERDAIGIYDTEIITVKAYANTKVLFIEVPYNY